MFEASSSGPPPTRTLIPPENTAVVCITISVFLMTSAPGTLCELSRGSVAVQSTQWRRNEQPANCDVSTSNR